MQSAKASRATQNYPTHALAQESDESMKDASLQEGGADMYGFANDWEDKLMDVWAPDLDNTLKWPLAGWPEFRETYGQEPPRPTLAKES